MFLGYVKWCFSKESIFIGQVLPSGILSICGYLEIKAIIQSKQIP